MRYNLICIKIHHYTLPFNTLHLPANNITTKLDAFLIISEPKPHSYQYLLTYNYNISFITKNKLNYSSRKLHLLLEFKPCYIIGLLKKIKKLVCAHFFKNIRYYITNDFYINNRV